MSEIKTKEELKTFRREIGYTQEQFANALNVKRGSYSNWETGQDKITKLKEINEFRVKYLEDQRKAKEQADKSKMEEVLEETDKKNAKARADTLNLYLADYSEALVKIKEAVKFKDTVLKDADLDGISKKELDTLLILKGMDKLVQFTLFEAIADAK